MSLTYLKLEIKKMFKYLPELFLGFVLFLIIAIGITLVSYSVYSSKKQDFKSYNVGIVQDKEDKYTSLAMEVVKNLDIIKKTVNFNNCTYEQAVDGVKNGTFDVIFIFPNGFADDVMYGGDSQIEVRYGNTKTSTVGFFMKDISALATDLIVQSERSIFALKDYYDLNNIEGKKEADRALNKKYFEVLLGRASLMDEETLQGIQTVDLVTHFFSAGLILVFLFLGTACAKIISLYDKEFYKKIRAFNVSSYAQVLIKILSTLLVFLFIYYLIITTMYILLSALNINIGELIAKTNIENIQASMLAFDNTSIYFALIKCSFMLLPIVTFLVLVFEIAPNTSSAVLSYFIIVISLAFASGYFYPDAFLPTSLRKIASFTYTKNILSYVTNTLYANNTFNYFINLLVHSVLFAVAATVIRERNLNRT